MTPDSGHAATAMTRTILETAAEPAVLVMRVSLLLLFLRANGAVRVFQNMYFREACISRAAPALLMIPKLELPRVPLGFPQLTELKALKASTLNWIWRPF